MTLTESSWNDQHVQSAVRDRLQAMSLIRMDLVRLEVGGWAYTAVRPSDPDAYANSFSVLLNRTPATVEAMLMTDLFAGQLVRRLGRVASQEESPWEPILTTAKRNGVVVTVRVNDAPFRHDGPKVPVWKNVEIECRARLDRRRDENHLTERWVDVSSTCLMLLLEGGDLEEVSEFGAGEPEGATITHLIERHERSPLNRLQSIAYHGYRCWVCDFDFAKTYGDIGASFTEVHHLFPISGMHKEQPVDPIREMVPLCANCHRMAHRSNPPIHPQELRNRLGLDIRPSVLAGGDVVKATDND